MKNSLPLFFLLSNCFCSGFSEKCPEGLHERFKKGFNLTEKCGDDCVVLNSEVSFDNHKWTGFCSRDCYTLFPDWKCRGPDDDGFADVFSRANRTCCEIFTKGAQVEDEDCFKIFNGVKCRADHSKLPTVSALNQSSSEDSSELPLTSSKKPSCSRHSNPTTSTALSVVPSIVTPSASTLTPFATVTFPTSTCKPIPSPGTTKCEENEDFFEGHCYFLTYNKCKGNENKLLNSTLICQRHHPGALGLAVETKRENDFIMSTLAKVNLPGYNILLTSGIKQPNSPGQWMGWNLSINPSVVHCNENLDTEFKFYTISANKGEWSQRSLTEITSLKDVLIWTVCERLYNPRNIIPELHEKCLELYRNSKCYDITEHKNYCCAKDEAGNLWFGCPEEDFIKKDENGECSWFCGSDGYFTHQYRTCKGKFECRQKHKGIEHRAALGTYAAGSCPVGLSGHSKWYCSMAGKFVNTPEYSLCCPKKTKVCKSTDPYLNFWMACSMEKAYKKLNFSSGSGVKEAIVEWQCLSNGSFLGSSPNYTNYFNNTRKTCRKNDTYGQEWEVLPGSTGRKPCPPGSKGFCFWKCGNFSGEFESPEPNCADCQLDWVNEVENLIHNKTHHQKVMKVVENYTKVMDLSTGFHSVLKLISKCTDLFKGQNANHSVSIFDEFLTSYVKLFKNVAGNTTLWSSFGVTDRKVYAEEVLQMSQNAAFSYNGSMPNKYNATLATDRIDGFDFFVSYSPVIKGSRFPLENFQQSDWQLRVEDVNDNGFQFAVMGLVMNYSLSSLMFPQGSGTKEMKINSPVVTFTVAAFKSQNLTVVENVTVHLSFRHVNRTRFPMTQIIKRRLHKGETPSGVVNSTFCYYYKDPDWSTDGCVVTFSSKDMTNCTCKHLSSIGLLMTIHKYIPNKTLETISLVSSSITIVSLVLALIVFYVFDSVKNERVFIGKNSCFCLLVGHFMLVTVMDKRFFYISDNLCVVYAVLLHYMFMAAFSWMFVEGCHLYRMLVLVFDSDIEYRLVYTLIGYGVPLVVVGVTQIIGLVFQEQPYGQDEMCWLKPPNYTWAFIGPIIVSTLINFLILLRAMKLAVTSKMTTEKTKLENIKIWVKGWISLSSLLGITWLLGLVYLQYNEVFVYSFIVLNGLQGFFIFIFRCVFSEQYRAAFLRKLKVWFPALEQQATQPKTGTKLFGITQSDAKSSGNKNIPDSGYDTDILRRLDNQIYIQRDILKELDKFRLAKTEAKIISGNSSGVELGIEITVTPAASEEYLRNRFTIKNLQSIRKSNGRFDKKNNKQRENELENFPELSYHTNYLEPDPGTLRY